MLRSLREFAAFDHQQDHLTEETRCAIMPGGKSERSSLVTFAALSRQTGFAGKSTSGEHCGLLGGCGRGRSSSGDGSLGGMGAEEHLAAQGERGDPAALTGRLFRDMVGALELLTVYLGERLGLYQALYTDVHQAAGPGGGTGRHRLPGGCQVAGHD